MMDNEQGTTLTAVDLFSGPGGMTVGLKRAGFAVLGAIEVEPVAVETYEHNHPTVSVLSRNIRAVDPLQWMQDLRITKGSLTLLAGCPPCQGFSSIRTRNGSTEACDGRNDLVFEILRFARVMLPKVILMENVPGLMGNHRLSTVTRDLENLGYELCGSPTILNAADYGVPQKRRRLVLLASRVGRIAFPKPHINSPTVETAIAHLLPPGQLGDALHDYKVKRSARVMEIIRAIPRDGGSRLDLPSELRLDCHSDFSGFKDVYGRMAWDRPAPTITGGCFNPSKGRFLHPQQDRNITLREAAILQGFSEDYYFSLSGGKVKAAMMIGNALPPPFVEAHAVMIAKHLEGEPIN